MLPGWELALPPLPQMTSWGDKSSADKEECWEEVEDGDDGTSYADEFPREVFSGGRLGISLFWTSMPPKMLLKLILSIRSLLVLKSLIHSLLSTLFSVGSSCRLAVVELLADETRSAEGEYLP